MQYVDKIDTPERQDRVIAARTASVMSMVAGLWFFVSPWAYYGGSNASSGWNAWIVGAVLFLSALIRSWSPLYTEVFAKANAVLAVWILISPWVYDYTAYTGRFVNSLCVGSFVLGMSIGSIMIMRKRQSM